MAVIFLFFNDGLRNILYFLSQPKLCRVELAESNFNDLALELRPPRWGNQVQSSSILIHRDSRQSTIAYDSLALKFLYFSQLAFYLTDLIELVLKPNTRSDFYVFLVHHFVTIFLIVGSFVSKNVDTGLVVFLLHDVSDIPVCV